MVTRHRGYIDCRSVSSAALVLTLSSCLRGFFLKNFILLASVSSTHGVVGSSAVEKKLHCAQEKTPPGFILSQDVGLEGHEGEVAVLH